VKSHWKPGAVAVSDFRGTLSLAMVVEGRTCPESHPRRPHWHGMSGGWNHLDDELVAYRPVVVIDPESYEDAENVAIALTAVLIDVPGGGCMRADTVQAAFRSLAAGAAPEEPTDPKARVTDRRENIWRLLADGDWVCTSGPDTGEYIVWGRLVERGPLSVEVVDS
jgi:hypothetical protein